MATTKEINKNTAVIKFQLILSRRRVTRFQKSRITKKFQKWEESIRKQNEVKRKMNGES